MVACVLLVCNTGRSWKISEIKRWSVCVKVLFQTGKYDKKTHEMLSRAFNDDVSSESQAYEWFKRFKKKTAKELRMENSTKMKYLQNRIWRWRSQVWVNKSFLLHHGNVLAHASHYAWIFNKNKFYFHFPPYLFPQTSPVWLFYIFLNKTDIERTKI